VTSPEASSPTSAGYTLSDFDYELPAELIAQAPAAQRTASRLLHLRGDELADRRFADLPSLVEPRDLVVFNDTRVIKARLRGRKPSGGAVEMLVERMLAARRLLVQLKASHPPRVGATIDLAGGARARVVARDGRFFALDVADVDDLAGWIERHGEVPLPPYITRVPDAADAERYQTVYARHAGAVAAPTAGLHFDEAMLDALAGRGVARAFVTLHVGAGTFEPVRTDDLTRHRMHAETYVVPAATAEAIAAARARGGRVLAVGTTTLRALESAADAHGSVRAGGGETTLFVTPGYRFRVVDRLLTNFHLPKSTLLMLVSAFGGIDAIRRAYAHAAAARYRFMSYGDAMLIERRDATP